jgi:hypothetical protein
LEAVFGFIELVVGVGVLGVVFGGFGECLGGGGVVGIDGGEVEGGVGLEDALETPGEGDGAVGEVELGGGLGGEGLEPVLAELGEFFGVIGGEDGGLCVAAVAEGVLGGGLFALGGAGAGGFLGVGAVGLETFFGDGDGGHGDFPFLGGSFELNGVFPPGDAHSWVRNAPLGDSNFCLTYVKEIFGEFEIF